MKKLMTDLEHAVLEKILGQRNSNFANLRSQLESCRVKSRELTGVGFFTELEVDSSLPAAQIKSGTVQVGSAEARVQGLKYGAGFTLFITNGYLDMLEGYSYGEPWPLTVTKFDLDFASAPQVLSNASGPK